MPPSPLSRPLPLSPTRQLKEHNPKLGRQAKVLTSSLDRVYEFAVAPRGAAPGLEGVTFRFMPDAKQVDAALQVRDGAAGRGGAARVCCCCCRGLGEGSAACPGNP